MDDTATTGSHGMPNTARQRIRWLGSTFLTHICCDDSKPHDNGLIRRPVWLFCAFTKRSRCRKRKIDEKDPIMLSIWGNCFLSSPLGHPCIYHLLCSLNLMYNAPRSVWLRLRYRPAAASLAGTMSGAIAPRTLERSSARGITYTPNPGRAYSLKWLKTPQ